MRISDWSSDVCSSDLSITVPKAFELGIGDGALIAKTEDHERSRCPNGVSRSDSGLCFRFEKGLMHGKTGGKHLGSEVMVAGGGLKAFAPISLHRLRSGDRKSGV